MGEYFFDQERPEDQEKADYEHSYEGYAEVVEFAGYENDVEDQYGLQDREYGFFHWLSKV